MQFLASVFWPTVYCDPIRKDCFLSARRFDLLNVCYFVWKYSSYSYKNTGRLLSLVMNCNLLFMFFIQTAIIHECIGDWTIVRATLALDHSFWSLYELMIFPRVFLISFNSFKNFHVNCCWYWYYYFCDLEYHTWSINFNQFFPASLLRTGGKLDFYTGFLEYRIISFGFFGK